MNHGVGVFQKLMHTGNLEIYFVSYPLVITFIVSIRILREYRHSTVAAIMRVISFLLMFAISIDFSRFLVP